MADKEYVDIFEEEQSSNIPSSFGKGFVKGLDTPKDLLVDLPLGVFQAGSNLIQGQPLMEDTIPNIPGLEDAMYFLSNMEQAQNKPAELTGMLTGGIGSGVATIAVLNKIKKINKPLYRKLTRMYPFSVGQFHVAANAVPNTPGWWGKITNMFKGTVPTKKVLGKIANNIFKIGRAGSLFGILTPSEMGEDWGGHGSYEGQLAADSEEARNKIKAETEQNKQREQELLKLLEELNAGSADRDEMLQAKKDGGIIQKKAYGGDPDDFNLKDLDLGPAFEGIGDLDIFEEAKKEGYEEVQVAGLGKELFGKVPIWAVGGVDKAKMLLQNLSKNEKNILRSITEKLGLKTEKGKKVEDVVEDIDIIGTPAGGQ